MISTTEEDIRTDQIVDKTTLCPLPWKQLQVTTCGGVNPCCIWNGRPVGNLHQQEFDRIWNGPGLRKIRTEMMNGEKPTGCQKCYFLEQIGTRSPRWYACRKFLSRIDTLTENTSEYGVDSEFKIECWDIRFSNRCNLSCRMCGPEASTAWYRDAELAFSKDYTESVKTRVNTPEISQKLLDYLLTHLNIVTEIYFVGGEPLLMPEHYKVLDEILKEKYSSIYLRYNTNLTTLGAEDKAIDYWLKLKEQGNLIEVGLSLDAIGPVAEYQRYGCSWEKVANNLRKLIENGIHLMVMPTVSIINVWHVQDLIDYCLDLGIAGYDIAVPNIVVGPSHYDMRILPEKEKEETITRIREYLSNHEAEEEKNYGVRHKFFDPILAFLETSLDGVGSARKEFVRITEILDGIRNQKFEEINPQYKNWKTWRNV